MEQGRGGSKGERSTGSCNPMGGPGLCAGLSSPHLPAMSHSTCHGSQSPRGASQLTGEPDAAAPMPREEASPGASPTKPRPTLDKPRVHVGLKGPESPIRATGLASQQE